METPYKFNLGDRVRIKYNIPTEVRKLWPAWNSEMPGYIGKIYIVKSKSVGYENNAYNLFDNPWEWNEQCLELVKDLGKWTTYLIDKGLLKEANMTPFTTNEPVEEEEVLKKYRVHCSETHYFYYELEASSEEEAEDMAHSGDYDAEEDSYDGWAIDSVEEV